MESASLKEFVAVFAAAILASFVMYALTKVSGGKI